MQEVPWPRARSSLWRIRAGAVLLTLCAFGLGATFRNSFDVRAGRGDIRLATKIAEDESVPRRVRLQALTAMRRDVLQALRTFDRLSDHPELGSDARNFAKVDVR